MFISGTTSSKRAKNRALDDHPRFPTRATSKKSTTNEQSLFVSFVKNVTSTVSSLLPSSITKWFNISNTSNTNGSVPTEDPTDSSSEDEIPETSVVIQPPQKRMRYNSPKKNHLGQSEVNYSANSVDAIEQYDIIQPITSRHHIKSGPNYVSTPIHSVINEPSNEKRERETTVIKSHSYKGSTFIKKRKSLFEKLDKESSKQANKETVIKETSSSNDYSQPYFKPSLFTSPFYRGNITYGGAASSYLNQPNIKSSKITRVNETSKHDNTVSHSVKRVMDLLEQYSSPLLEAKRISPYVTSQNISMENSSLPSEKSHSYKTQELHVPSIASILSLKQRSRIMDTTNAARQIIASHSSAINYSPYPKSKAQSESSNKETTGKIRVNLKSRVIRTKRSESTDLINDLPSPIKLPTAVLEIDQNNLPKFNFGKSVVSTSCSLSNQTASIPKTTLTVAPESKVVTNSKELSRDIQSSEHVPDSNSYKFATPVIVSRNITLTSQVPKFTFEYPTKNVDEIDSCKEKEKTSPVLIIEDDTNTTKEKPKDWRCSDCWVVNKADASNCVCCSAKKPQEQKKASNLCTVCQSEVTKDVRNKCSKCEKAQKSNGSTLTPTTSIKSKSWKCGDCWVNNAESSDKCVCCGWKNTKSSENTENQSNIPESDWKCSDCWIKNKSNVDKCIACGGEKPNSALNSKPAVSLVTKQNLTSSSFVRDNTYNNILKAQSEKWECSNCLVKNDIDKTKCACCETEKTGVMKEAKTTSFNFGMNTNTSFKFGTDPKVQVDNCNKDMDSEECIELSATNEKLETNNNVLAKTSTFSFGLPVNNIDDKNKETLPTPVSQIGEVPKLNFTFGIPKQTTNTTETVKLIKNNNDQKEKEPTAITEEKLQEVPTINITQVQSQNAVIEQKNISESKLCPQESLPKIPSSNKLVTGIATEEKDITFKSSIMQTATNIETSKSNTFTQTGLKISSNLFSIPTSSIANAGTNTDSTLSAPVTASSSLFQKSYIDIKPTENLFPKMGPSPSDTNLFQNPTTTAAPTAPTFSASSNLFSFGNNTQNSVPEPGHSKFNFSFGNTNKADTTPMFNATFGLNKDSSPNPNSNKFTLPTLNNIGTNSSLGGNSLGAGNLLSTGNPIMSNTLSGNTTGMTTGNQLGVPDLGNNSLNAGNNLKSVNSLSTTPSNGIFGGTGQKENMWSNSNSAPGNLFVSNATTNSVQRPATFTFGSSTPFNTNDTGTAFGNNTSSNVFIMQNSSSNVPTLFSNSPQPQTVPTIFGNSQNTSTAPTMGVFGSTNPPSNSFNVHNPTIPSFEAQPQNSMTVPSFNFSSQQLGTVPFGFGQQQPHQFQSTVYNFGASQSTPQFNMGSAPNTTVRRVRKAVRRTTQR